MAVYERDREKALFQRIRALRAKAEHANTSEAESMIFMAKVTELMQEHGLAEAQLSVEEQEGVNHEEVEANWSASPARKAMLFAVCALYMVRALHYAGTKRWVFVGRPANVIMAKEMAEYLLKTTVRLSNQYKKQTGGNNIDFRRGCFARLTERLFELKRNQTSGEATYTKTGNPSNLPALYANEVNLLEEYMRKAFPHTKTMRRSAIRYGADGMAGRTAGDGISLNQQVANGGSVRLIGKKK
jgi:hypothetical protein